MFHLIQTGLSAPSSSSLLQSLAWPLSSWLTTVYDLLVFPSPSLPSLRNRADGELYVGFFRQLVANVLQIVCYGWVMVEELEERGDWLMFSFIFHFLISISFIPRRPSSTSLQFQKSLWTSISTPFLDLLTYWQDFYQITKQSYQQKVPSSTSFFSPQSNLFNLPLLWELVVLSFMRSMICLSTFPRFLQSVRVQFQICWKHWYYDLPGLLKPSKQHRLLLLFNHHHHYRHHQWREL